MNTWDYIVCECDLAPLQNFVEMLEPKYDIQLIKSPSTCLTMIKAEDTVEFQPFYLGEALTSECEVMINQVIGTGLCLGDEPLRCYCIAVIDALLQIRDSSLPDIEKFLTDQHNTIEHNRKVEYNHILRTKVDFKLMEQE